MSIRLDEDADMCGTCKIGEYRISPAILVRAFGEPNSTGDGYKVDAEYLFSDEEGNVYSLYAYKATSLYDAELPTPEAFWQKGSPQEFSIGGSADAPASKLIDCLNTLLGGL